MIDVNVVLGEGAAIPTQAHKGDAGYDLYASTDVVAGFGATKIPTGVRMEMLGEGCYFGDIRTRSSWFSKFFVKAEGVIDAPYRGEIMVMIHNYNPFKKIHIKKGERVAQIIFQRYEPAVFHQVTELSDTDRGNGGFGSSGR